MTSTQGNGLRQGEAKSIEVAGERTCGTLMIITRRRREGGQEQSISSATCRGRYRPHVHSADQRLNWTTTWSLTRSLVLLAGCAATSLRCPEARGRTSGALDLACPPPATWGLSLSAVALPLRTRRALIPQRGAAAVRTAAGPAALVLKQLTLGTKISSLYPQMAHLAARACTPRPMHATCRDATTHPPPISTAWTAPAIQASPLHSTTRGAAASEATLLGTHFTCYLLS